MDDASPRHCAQCRYDLRGADPESDCCPECGQTLTPAALAALRERRFLSGMAIVLLLVGVTGLGVAGAATLLLPDRAWILVPLFGVIMAMGAAPVLAAALGERSLSDE